MCGRYTLTSQKIVEDLELAVAEPSEPSEWWRPRFNIAPTQPAPVVPNREGPRGIEMMRWGLLPPWSKSLSESSRRINARVETAATSPAFRDALRQRRCLVLADGFFEWRDTPEGRAPFYIRPVPRRPVTFAGLWERWKDPGGSWVLTFAILTGPANKLVAPYHHRMPLVVERSECDRWLDRSETEPTTLMDILAPWSPHDWRVSPVSPHVNRPQNDDPSCVEPILDSPLH